MRSRPDERIYWIDSLKAIGITFVVLGHTRGLSEWDVNYIFSFHMPLFFFISGLLLRREALTDDFLTYMGKKARRLLSPYVFFGVLTYIAWVSVLRRYGERSSLLMKMNPLSPLYGMLYGTINLLPHDGPLWFFPCMFMAVSIFYWIAKMENKLVIAAMLVVSGVIGYYSVSMMPFRLPWNIDIAFTAVVFLGTGYLMKDFLRAASRPGLLRSLMVMSACILCQALIVKYNGRVDVASGKFGDFLLFYAGAFSGIIFWVTIARHIARSRLIAGISMNTDVIFSMHLLAFSLITAAGVFIFGLSPQFKNGSFLIAVVYSVISISVLTPVGSAIRRYIPWAVGARKVLNVRITDIGLGPSEG